MKVRRVSLGCSPSLANSRRYHHLVSARCSATVVRHRSLLPVEPRATPFAETSQEGGRHDPVSFRRTTRKRKPALTRTMPPNVATQQVTRQHLEQIRRYPRCIATDSPGRKPHRSSRSSNRRVWDSATATPNPASILMKALHRIPMRASSLSSRLA